MDKFQASKPAFSKCISQTLVLWDIAGEKLDLHSDHFEMILEDAAYSILFLRLTIHNIYIHKYKGF